MNKKIFTLIVAVIISLPVFSFYASAAEIIEKDGKIYYMEDSGDYITGWKTIDGNKYFFKKTGEAVTKSCIIGGVRYKFTLAGVCKGKYTGWTKSGSKRYYYIDGKKQTDWYKFSDGWHYFDDNGVHTTGSTEIYGKIYKFSSEGVWNEKSDTSYAGIISKIEKRLLKEDYSGIYIDSNVLVVMSVNDDTVSTLLESFKNQYAPIVVKHCEFSLAQLESVKNTLSKSMKKYGISGISTDIKNNRVVVESSEINDSLQKYIDSLENSDILFVDEVELTLIDD